MGADGAPLAAITASRKLVIGCINWPPFAKFHRDGSSVSFSELYVEVLQEIGRRNNIDVQFLPTRASQIVPQLENAQVDAIACLLETPQRRHLGEVVDARFGVPVIGVVRKEGVAKWNPQRLRDRSTIVAAVVGEVGEEVARTRYGATCENGRLITIDTDYVPGVFLQIALGNADIALVSGTRWLQYCKDVDPAEINLCCVFADLPLLLVPCGVFVRANCDELRDWLDRELYEMWDRPELQERCRQIVEDYGPFIVPL
ncbi:substrate-binding periplasmic protein [Nonomuraea sp. NPDC003560]|uniref:substrate-binding periplasmic protein n=1 Tax=Nonomuraea sp. NPDC003560 TaxID=3364341 RepID=UPI0036BDE3FA